MPAVVMAVTFPELARAHADPAERRRLERLLASCLLALGVVMGAACFFGSSPLVAWVFGADFHRAAASLRVLALGVPLLYVNSGLTHFLVARDRERVTTWLALMMLVLVVVLDLVLIPQRAGPGAALATVLAEVVAHRVLPGGARDRGGRPARTPPSVQESPRTDRTAA